MHYFAINSILAGIAAIFLGNFVFYRNPRDALSRVFFVLCLVAAYLAFTESFMRQAASQNAAYFWMRLTAFWPFTIALTAHFILIYTEKSALLKNKLIQFFIYGSAALISLVDLTTDFLTAKPVMAYWGCWTPSVTDKSLVLGLTAIWIVAINIFMFHLVVGYYLKTVKEKRKQTVYVLIGTSFPVVLGVGTEGILPFIGIKFPELTTTGFIIGAIFLGYAIWKHRLFALTPATAAESIIYTMVDSLLLVNAEGKIVMANESAAHLLGYRQSQLVDQPLDDILVLEGNSESNETWIQQLLEADAVNSTEGAFKTKNDREIPVSLSTSAVRNGDNTQRGIVIVGRDLTERKEFERQLTFLASHDPLTGLPNRRSLEEILKRVIARASRGPGSALLFLDTDNFKIINDSYGHMVGDKVLANLAQAIRRGLRDGDFLARTGGDEFAIVLEQTDVEEAQVIAERVRQTVKESTFVINAKRFQLSVSIGVAPIDGRQGISVLMAQADKAMYEAKEKGRNRVAFLDSYPRR